MRFLVCVAVALGLAWVCPASAATSGQWVQVEMAADAASWRLTDVSTLSAQKAFLVGIDANTGSAMVARYDGQGGFRSVYQAAGPSLFRAVAKTRFGRAWAVGYTNPDSEQDQQPLIAHFVGHWHPSAPARLDVQGNLWDVAAVNDHNVWAVGSRSNDGWYNSRSLVEHYNGDRWRIAPSPNPSRCATPPGCVGFTNDLVAVAATRGGTVFVAGQANGLPGPDMFLLRRDHGRWHRLALPRLPGYNQAVGAVVARSARNAWFVGSYSRKPDGKERPLVLHWNGATLRRVAAASPAGWDGSVMQSVTRTSSGIVYAVGNAFQPWAENQATIWRLTRHGFIPMQIPQIYDSTLGGISAGGGFVLAVGGSDGPSPLTLRLDESG